MRRANHLHRSVVVLLSLLFLFAQGEAQKKIKSTDNGGKHVLWSSVDVSRQDLFLGPGGSVMEPDLSNITFLKEEKGGYSTKYRIKDGAGNTWVAKVGLEAQSETAAVRLLSGIGYVTEINYLVPSLSIPGKGRFSNVRLEARPNDVDRGKEWRWGKTPFEGTRQMKGLMLMMAFINNWDMKSANNVILKKGNERHYVISDLGVSFGKTGSSSLPLFWRIGRSRNNPRDYAKSTFVTGVKENRVKVKFNGKNRSRMDEFTVADARWLADLLTQLSDRQIADAFRAANYSQSDIGLLSRAVRSRIRQLDEARTNSRNSRRR
ncbi:MAG: hypothetical protein ACKVRN_06485 [Pyrinomonadaceae bacterium]